MACIGFSFLPVLGPTNASAHDFKLQNFWLFDKVSFMKHSLIHPTHSRRGSARTIALMSLLLSLVACLLAGIALLVAVNGGRLPQSDLLARRSPTPKAEAAPALPQSAGARDASAQWDQVRDRLRRAETMVARRDGRAQEYLDQLKADMERLMRNSSDGGGKWMSDAVAKVKAIREQVAVNGPEAARRLRELSTDLAEKVRTLYRAAEALQSMMPKKAQGAPAPAAEAAPEVPEVPQTR
jgi:hypothetical protein